MGKKSKGDRKTKSGRHEEEEDDHQSDYMHDVMTDSAVVEEREGFSTGSGTSIGGEKVGKHGSQIDQLLDGIDNLDSKKSQVRVSALGSIVKSLQSGADLFDRVYSNMDTLMAQLKRLLSQRSASAESVLAMKVVCILALVAGADNDEFTNEFSELLITLATKSEVEEVELRVAAVRTLAFIHLVCGGGSGGFSCFGVIGDIALLQSEGIDACQEVQVAAADAWCLLAHLVDPQKVCDVSREEDMFVELVTLLGSANTEVRRLSCECCCSLIVSFVVSFTTAHRSKLRRLNVWPCSGRWPTSYFQVWMSLSVLSWSAMMTKKCARRLPCCSRLERRALNV